MFNDTFFLVISQSIKHIVIIEKRAQCRSSDSQPHVNVSFEF